MFTALVAAACRRGGEAGARHLLSSAVREHPTYRAFGFVPLGAPLDYTDGRIGPSNPARLYYAVVPPSVGGTGPLGPPRAEQLGSERGST